MYPPDEHHPAADQGRRSGRHSGGGARDRRAAAWGPGTGPAVRAVPADPAGVSGERDLLRRHGRPASGCPGCQSGSEEYDHRLLVRQRLALWREGAPAQDDLVGPIHAAAADHRGTWRYEGGQPHVASGQFHRSVSHAQRTVRSASAGDAGGRQSRAAPEGSESNVGAARIGHLSAGQPRPLR